MDNRELSKDIIQMAIKYLNMTELEASSALSNVGGDFNLSCLSMILHAAAPYFQKYSDVTSNELKRKIGRVAFTKINYLSLRDNGEMPTHIYDRLSAFFRVTSNYGINPYEIFYSSVITNAHLFINREGNFSQYKYSIGNFSAVSSAIEKQLNLPPEKVANMFEKCSSLAYKADVNKIEKNYAAIQNFYYDSDYVLNNIDVKEIFRNNPSLYTCSDSQINSAFDYLTKKAETFKHTFADKRNVRDILCEWIKNNSSALTINVNGMLRKERALELVLSKFYSRNVVNDIINSLFDNPTSICALNKISTDTFFYSDGGKNKNYAAVIRTLAHFLDDSKNDIPGVNTYKYLKNAKLVYSVKNKRLFDFLSKVQKYDKGKSTNLLQNFAERGDAIYPFFEKYSDEEIIEKLETNKILYRIKIYNMTKLMIAHKFYEIFSPYPEQNIAYFENVLRTNHDYETLCKYLDEVEGYVDLVNDSTNSHRKMFFASMLEKSVDAFLGVCHEYENKYIKTDLQHAMQDFNSRVEFIKLNIDELFVKGVEKAKKNYENVDMLYKTFKENTEEKLSDHSNPIKRQERVIDLIKGASESIQKLLPDRQLSFYENPSEEENDHYAALKSLRSAIKNIENNLGKDDKAKRLD